MRKVCVLALLGVVALTQAVTSSLDGLYALVERQIPQHAQSFAFVLVEGEGDSFSLSDSSSKLTGSTQIRIQCTTVSACARGIYHYVTEYGNVDIWWTGSRLHELATKLPPVRGDVNISAIVPYRYHFNTVTFSYTAAFWNFTQWEQELDWMALRGVNLPLAWVGYEHVLTEVFLEYGLTMADITAFYSGAAFQPWNRFGNVHGSWIGGPLPEEWNNQQFELQKKILARMNELGMTPVMPAFPGFVPSALAKRYSNASIVAGSQWGGDFELNYTDTLFLEPTDPLFGSLQQSFISKQQATYGNVSHIYTLDQYNENNPASNDPAYLANISSATWAALRAADPDAVWMMQGWLFYAAEAFWGEEQIQAYLGAVPGNDSMIILDLFSEGEPQWQRTDSYGGKQWVWCELHDFGGNMGMEGNLPGLTSGPISALAVSPNMKGMGLTPEGQEGNEIVYDIVFDQAWSSTPLNVTEYAQKWAQRRYYIRPLPSPAVEAWLILGSTVYNNSQPDTQVVLRSIYELAPDISGDFSTTTIDLPYDTNSSVVPALRSLLLAAKQNAALKDVPEFLYDVVDITRQLLANRFIDRYLTLVTTFNSTSPPPSFASIEAAGRPLLDIFPDLEAILSTNEQFQLATWVNSARALAGGNKTYADYLELNARTQITIWGPDPPYLNDYASKQWSGLVGTYYRNRWATFVSYLANVTAAGEPYNGTFITAEMYAMGERWAGDLGLGVAETGESSPDTVLAIAQKLLDKYS